MQIAAALLLGALDDGWEGSTRRRALLSVFHGPVDWCTTAAIIALVEIARTEPEHAAAIRAILVAELDAPVNPVRWGCIVEPLLTLLERAGVDGGTVRRMGAIRRESDQGT